MSKLRTLAEIEAAGAALAATEPPLTDAQIARLVILLAPAFPAATAKAAAHQRPKIAA